MISTERREDRRVLAFEKREILGVGDHAVFHRLGESGGELHTRERGQELRVGDDDAWLVKRAEQILTRGDVDTGLAADRGVDHREQGRRHLYQRDAAEVGRRDEAGEIVHDAAAERDHRRVAPELRGEHSVRQRCPGVARLVRFAGGEGEQLDLHTDRGQLCGEGLAVRFSHVRIRDERVRRRGAVLRQDLVELVDKTGADQDVVGGIPLLDKRDADRHHTMSERPARLFTARARTNSKSDSRLR